MSVDAGDIKYQPGHSVTLDAGDNDVGGGEAVTFDGDGHITNAEGGDFVVGTTLHTLKDGDHDSKWTVSVAGLGVVVETDDSVDPGDHLEGAGDGTYQSVTDPDADTGYPFVLHSEDEDENLYVAIFR